MAPDVNFGQVLKGAVWKVSLKKTSTDVQTLVCLVGSTSCNVWASGKQIRVS